MTGAPSTRLDAATGKVRWTFDTVKDGDLWGHPEINSGGGAWYPPAIDERTGMLYIGIANPAPFVGTPQFPNGTSRPGANLYTDSLLALDLHTGALRWYHQVTSHDIFDRDQVHALIARGAGGREVVVSAGKSGVVVGLDPRSGKVLWQRAIGTHEHDDLTALTGPTQVMPGTYGGVLTPPSTSRRRRLPGDPERAVAAEARRDRVLRVVPFHAPRRGRGAGRAHRPRVVVDQAARRSRSVPRPS